jgi:DNA-binding phage protein
MASKPPISEQLREAVRRSDRSRYRICKESGIDQGVMSRFLNTDANLSLASVDKLCKVIGLRLVSDAKPGKPKATKRAATKAASKKR